MTEVVTFKTMKQHVVGHVIRRNGDTLWVKDVLTGTEWKVLESLVTPWTPNVKQ